MSFVSFHFKIYFQNKPLNFTVKKKNPSSGKFVVQLNTYFDALMLKYSFSLGFTVW